MEAKDESKPKERKSEAFYKKVKDIYYGLKSKSGSHSPSSMLIQKTIPEIDLKIDCCFLSNPYATESFMKRFKNKIKDDVWLTKSIESYPAQNAQIAEEVALSTGIKAENIFIGNGATEAISAIVNRYIKGKLLLMLPTFSPYYEYVNKETTIYYYPLQRDNEKFFVDLEQLYSFCKINSINNMIIINPNNPDGSLILKADMENYLKKFSYMDNIVLDESFIEFAGGDESVVKSFYNYPNLTIIKSMSKIFGIAGLRTGYCITKAEYVKELLSNGYLWNSNCFAIYFFSLLRDPEFMKEYEEAKEKYNKTLNKFGEDLYKVNPKFRFYRSKGNFFLGELLDKEKTMEDFVFYMLCEYGIYVRGCGDKKGLNDRFVRISCRTEEENDKVIEAIKNF